MSLQTHLLDAMTAQLSDWQHFLDELRTEQITAPRFDLGWSIQDVVAHLWAWQQINNSRLQAALDGGEPISPDWVLALGPGGDDDSDRANAAIFAANHSRPWGEVRADWQAGYAALLKRGSRLSEPQLLDFDHYPWLHGYSLADILLSTYAHHQEHLDKTRAAMQ